MHVTIFSRAAVASLFLFALSIPVTVFAECVPPKFQMSPTCSTGYKETGDTTAVIGTVCCIEEVASFGKCPAGSECSLGLTCFPKEDYNVVGTCGSSSSPKTCCQKKVHSSGMTSADASRRADTVPRYQGVISRNSRRDRHLRRHGELL